MAHLQRFRCFVWKDVFNIQVVQDFFSSYPCIVYVQCVIDGVTLFDVSLIFLGLGGHDCRPPTKATIEEAHM